MDQVSLEKHMQAIQSGLKRSGRVMVLSGSQAIVRGIGVVAGTAVSFFLIGKPWTQMLALWIAVALAIFTVEALLYVRLRKKNPDTYISGIEKQILKFTLLLLAVGMAFSAAFVHHGVRFLIPGMWMIVIGIVYVICGFFSFSRTWILGVIACTGGCASLFLEPLYFFIILGSVLGLGSIVYGLILKAAKNGE